MAINPGQVYPTATSIVGVTDAATFIPELWSDEVIAAYKKSLKMAPLVKRLPMNGKKGDKINIPKPVRGSAAAKAENTLITIQATTEGNLAIDINRHFEYSRLIEDIVSVQALNSLRQFYTDDAGYALAKQIDTDLMNAATGFGNGTLDLAPAATGADWVNSNSYYVDATDGLKAYAVDTVDEVDLFDDDGFRSAIKVLDDADVPMDGRVFIIPPCLKKTITGETRFVSSDFRNDRTVGTGYIGDLYGIEVYVSSNCPVVETAANNTVSAVDTRGAILMHKDAIVLAEQMSVRTQTQYKQEYLADLFTADCLYGVQAYRPEAGFIISVPDL